MSPECESGPQYWSVLLAAVVVAGVYHCRWPSIPVVRGCRRHRSPSLVLLAVNVARVRRSMVYGHCNRSLSSECFAVVCGWWLSLEDVDIISSCQFRLSFPLTDNWYAVTGVNVVAWVFRCHQLLSLVAVDVIREFQLLSAGRCYQPLWMLPECHSHWSHAETVQPMQAWTTDVN